MEKFVFNAFNNASNSAIILLQLCSKIFYSLSYERLAAVTDFTAPYSVCAEKREKRCEAWSLNVFK